MNMEGPPAVGHASPASSVGEADPHLVSVFHIACMPFLPPSRPRTHSDGCQQIVFSCEGVGVSAGSLNTVFTSDLFLVIALFCPLSPEKCCID